MSDIRFTLVVYDYESDHRADLKDWRYDERWDALLAAADAMFDGDVDYDAERVLRRSDEPSV